MKTTVLFSGQGELPSPDTITMWRCDPTARAVWDEAGEAVGEPIDRWLDEGVPSDTRRAQLISAVGSLATFAVLERDFPVAPAFVLGHSVGEVAAVAVAAGLDVGAAARIVDIRGRVMQEAIESGPPMGMRAIIDPPAGLDEIVDSLEDVHVANRNSSRQVVVSGTLPALDELGRVSGLRSVPLKVTGAFHTPLMAVAAARFRDEVAGITIPSDFGPTVVANRTARPYEGDVLDELAKQIAAPVRWSESTRWAYDHCSQVFLDLSSTGMLARFGEPVGARIVTGGTPDAIDRLCRELRHVAAVDAKYDLASRALGVIVTTRNAQPDEAAYRDSVIPAYQELRGLAGKPDQPVARILDLVERVLEVKAVDADVRRRKLADLRWRSQRGVVRWAA